MRWQEFPIVGGAYKDDTRPWSCQDTVNYMPVMAERPGGRSPSLLRGVPGLVALAQLENAPVRGMHNAEGLLLAVVGNSLYRIAGDGGATNIGTIPGVGRVSMAHNQITYGNQVAIATGSTGYVYDTTTGQLSPITDESFPGAISFDFIDGYITGIEPGRRFAFFSDLADAFSYNALDRLQAESSPDRLVGQIISHREWWLFGERTVELYQNTGAATGTFQRSEGVVIEVGCASGDTIVNLDNSVFWLGNDGVVYRANGYTPQRVSTHAIEQDISRCNTAQSFAFTWVDRGHSVYYLTFPDGHTWGYDVAANEWHRRQSEKLDRWRINDVVRWNNQWVAGDFSNGNLYTMDWVAQHENGAILERRRTAGVLHDSQNAVVANGLEIVVDTGMPGLGHLEIHGSLGNGDVGQAVDFRYTASGGIPGYAFRIAGGSLPDGLTMDAQGHVTGTYATAGDYSWTVEVTDAMGSVADLDDGANIYAPMSLSGTFVDAIAGGESQTQKLTVTNGAPPYTADTANGEPPSGCYVMVYQGDPALVCQSAKVADPESFDVIVTDSTGQKATSHQKVGVKSSFGIAWYGTYLRFGSSSDTGWKEVQGFNPYNGASSAQLAASSDGSIVFSGHREDSTHFMVDVFSKSIYGYEKIQEMQIPNVSDSLYTYFQELTCSGDGSIVAANVAEDFSGKFAIFNNDGSGTYSIVKSISSKYLGRAKISISPSGKYMLSSSSESGDGFTVFSIDENGITELDASALPVGILSNKFAWHPDGVTFVCVVNKGGNSNDGLLCRVSSSGAVELLQTISGTFCTAGSTALAGLSGVCWSGGQQSGDFIYAGGDVAPYINSWSYDGISLTNAGSVSIANDKVHDIKTTSSGNFVMFGGATNGYLCTYDGTTFTNVTDQFGPITRPIQSVFLQ